MKNYIFILLFFLGSNSLIANHSNLVHLDHALMVPDTIKEESTQERSERIELEETRYMDLESNTEKRKADKMYQQLGFMASTEFYEDLVAEGKASFQVMAHLANSYRLNNDTENAEYWYAKIVKDTKQAEHFLHYAQVLQTNEKCEDAIRWFEIYQEASEDYNRTFIEDCAEIDELKSERGALVTNLKSLNTKYLDFCPIKYKDGVVFSSTRGISKVTKHLDLWTKSNFSDLFYVEYKEEGSPEFADPKPLEGDNINGKFHDGVATFNHSENFMVFTRNNIKGKSAEGLIDLQLYSSKKEGDLWEDVQRLNINSDEYASCHPTLAKDGKRLYFASNRPGGYGGMDIYMSRLNGSKWSKPVNLGPTVNSSGNEIFPHIDEDDKLYFSSNGHTGLGGLDIFIVQKYVKSDENSWSIRENIGSPLNSPKDDFGFMIVEKDKSGYLTSSRDGGMGQDDIYHWEITDGSKLSNKNKKLRERVLCVFDAATNDRIEDVKVSIIPTSESINSYNDELVLVLKKMEDRQDEYVLSLKDRNVLNSGGDFFRTDERGTFSYPVVPGQEFVFLIEKTGYVKTTQKVSASEILSEAVFCMPLKKRTGLYLEGNVKNKNFPKFIPNADITLISKCTGEKSTTVTDADGGFDFPLDCDCEYELFGEKEYFQRGFATVSTMGKDCSVLEVINTEIALEMKDIKNELKEKDKPAVIQYVNPTYQYPNMPYSNGYPTRNTYPIQNGAYVEPDNTYIGSDGKRYHVQPNTQYKNGYTLPNGIFIRPSNYLASNNPPTRGTIQNNPPQNPNSSNFVPIQGPLTPESLKEYFLGNSDGTFNVGQILILQHIYYDFDKYFIRNDAAEELDYLVALMNFYPSMEIGMDSHTDCRGSDNYNQWLSRKRAKAARQYLVNKGISSRRVHYANGKGEHFLANFCEDGVDCSEDEHQLNRRTEITITSFNQSGVQINSRK